MRPQEAGRAGFVQLGRLRRLGFVVDGWGQRDRAVDELVAGATRAAGGPADGIVPQRDAVAAAGRVHQPELPGHLPVAVRRAELEEAVKVLGGQLHMLGYRDSGYIGDPANEHPAAFINSDVTEAVGRVVALIRAIRPQVVVTHDETGGYFHPDHIHCCTITTAAWHSAGDPAAYPELGLAPYQPQRLYYSARSNRMTKVYAMMMRLRGQDPTRLGRNKDIDLTKIGIDPRRIHAHIDFRRYWDVKKSASAKHPSQGGGGGRFYLLPEPIQRRWLAKETYIRAFPRVADGYREYDLFDGVEL